MATIKVIIPDPDAGADTKRLIELAGFLRSVIHCGEGWTSTCERKYNEVIAAAMRKET